MNAKTATGYVIGTTEIGSILGPVDKVWEPYLCGGQGKEC